MGKQGENAAVQIVFDLTGWAKIYGSGTAVLLHQRSGDDEPYPVATTIEDGVLTWTVSNVDTVNTGKGVAELQYIVEDTLAKSVTYRTYVAASISSSTDVPDAYDTWLDSLTALAAKTQISADEAAASADEAEAYANLASEGAAAKGYFYVEGVDGSLYFVHTSNVEDISLEDDGSGGLEVVYGS